MPVVDLRGILTPVIGQVADIVFPDVVSIEAPVPILDATGDPFDTWTDVDSDVPALIEPLNRDTTETFMHVPILSTDVTITLAGDRDIRDDYRIRSQYVPPDDPDGRVADRWDCMGVARDPARVTTIVLGRRREPGTPADEGS